MEPGPHRTATTRCATRSRRLGVNRSGELARDARGEGESIDDRGSENMLKVRRYSRDGGKMSLACRLPHTVGDVKPLEGRAGVCRLISTAARTSPDTPTESGQA